METKIKTLYYGDNLEILRDKIADNTIDLCYIDPPFNSKRNYFQIYNNIGGKEDKAQMQAFVDTWTWNPSAELGFHEITTNEGGRFTRQTIELIRGLHTILGKSDLLAYIVSMTLRITEIFRVLKPTGSFYLHCDPTASHYLKLVLDAVFVSQGGDFLNEIIWHYRRWTGTSRRFLRMHDVIFFYSKSDLHLFNPLFTEYTKASLKRKQHYHTRIKDGDVFVTSVDKRGVKENDVWIIPVINSQAKERMGYPTQKPEALLERIIQASSNPGDLVLDAYCGCGTTVAVAERLDRDWIGIDITYHSISLMLKRLSETYGESILKEIKVDGIPQDLASARALANRKDDYVRKEFEKWAVLTYSNNRAVINEKKGADKGIDGVVYFQTGAGETERMIVQVKSGNVNRGTIATLKGDMERENAKIAVLLTLEEPTKPMLEEAYASGFYTHPLMQKDYARIKIVTARELIEENKRIEMPLSLSATRAAPRVEDNIEQINLFSDNTPN